MEPRFAWLNCCRKPVISSLFSFPKFWFKIHIVIENLSVVWYGHSSFMDCLNETLAIQIYNYTDTFEREIYNIKKNEI